jgi:hypothetical protein
MINEKTLSKIKKLLALAKSSNPFEAASALSRAQKLMQEHNVDNSAVELSDCNTHSLSFTKEKLNSYEFNLLHTVCRAFGVAVVVGYLWKNGKFVAHANFMGIAPQSELACYCFDVVYRQLLKNRADYLATMSNRIKRFNKTSRADDYAKGWVFEVSSKITDFAMTDEQKLLVEKYKAHKYDSAKLSTSKGVDRSNGKPKTNDLLNGMADARNVRLDKPMHGKETPKLTGAMA